MPGSADLRARLKYGLARGSAADELLSMLGGGLFSPFATHWYVDTFNGSADNDGRSWDRAFATMAAALTACATGDVVWFKGDVREELTGSNLKFDVTIIGALSQHHPDQPGSGSDLYDPGAAMWRPPASPTATTPLLEVRGRGWRFINIAFDCPVDAAAVKLVANASSGTSEYDASHASFINCSFQQGYRAIQDDGGLTNVTIDDCVFRIISVTGGCAIVNTSTSVRVPQYWRIRNCSFPGNGVSGGNESHIDAPLSGSLIRDCTFGTVEGTGKYIDLTGGDDNTVGPNNVFGGVYNTDDYVAGTADLWLGNWVTAISTQAPNGFTILAAAAP